MHEINVIRSMDGRPIIDELEVRVEVDDSEVDQ